MYQYWSPKLFMVNRAIRPFNPIWPVFILLWIIEVLNHSRFILGLEKWFWRSGTQPFYSDQWLPLEQCSRNIPRYLTTQKTVKVGINCANYDSNLSDVFLVHPWSSQKRNSFYRREKMWVVVCNIDVTENVFNTVTKYHPKKTDY